jgi:hypothetical protein
MIQLDKHALGALHLLLFVGIFAGADAASAKDIQSPRTKNGNVEGRYSIVEWISDNNVGVLQIDQKEIDRIQRVKIYLDGAYEREEEDVFVFSYYRGNNFCPQQYKVLAVSRGGHRLFHQLGCGAYGGSRETADGVEITIPGGCSGKDTQEEIDACSERNTRVFMYRNGELTQTRGEVVDSEIVDSLKDQ